MGSLEMTTRIRFHCLCGHVIEIDGAAHGKRVRCDHCGRDVPSPRLKRVASGVELRFNCRACGARLSVPLAQMARQRPCPRCGKVVPTPVVLRDKAPDKEPPPPPRPTSVNEPPPTADPAPVRPAEEAPPAPAPDAGEPAQPARALNVAAYIVGLVGVLFVLLAGLMPLVKAGPFSASLAHLLTIPNPFRIPAHLFFMWAAALIAATASLLRAPVRRGLILLGFVLALAVVTVHQVTSSELPPVDLGGLVRFLGVAPYMALFGGALALGSSLVSWFPSKRAWNRAVLMSGVAGALVVLFATNYFGLSRERLALTSQVTLSEGYRRPRAEVVLTITNRGTRSAWLKGPW